MATVDLAAVRPNRDTEDRPGPPAGLWAAPPLAPLGTRMPSTILSQVLYPKRWDPDQS